MTPLVQNEYPGCTWVHYFVTSPNDLPPSQGFPLDLCRNLTSHSNERGARVRRKVAKRVIKRVPVGLYADEHVRIRAAADEAGLSLARFMVAAAEQAIVRGGLTATAPEASVRQPVVVLRHGATIPAAALANLLPLMLSGQLGAYASHTASRSDRNSVGDVRLRVVLESGLVEVRRAGTHRSGDLVDTVAPEDAVGVAMRALGGGDDR